MTFYLIGLGLHDEKDVSVRGLEIIKACDTVYLEGYTSQLNCPVAQLEKFYGKKIIPASRELLEKSDALFEDAGVSDVAVLIVGDVFGATTHAELYLRAKAKGIDV